MMKMDEYISREDVLETLRKANIGGYITDRLLEIPTADVQPVNQWISVKDRLPESEKEVLVWYRYTWGDGSTSYGFGISWWYSNAKRWRDGCLLKGVEVLYWMPRPEPPKDGDANG